MDNKKNLTNKEMEFCELFTYGCAPYAGNPAKCYEFVYKAESQQCKFLALKLMERPHVKDYLAELEKLDANGPKYTKRFISENLKSIVEYCSTKEFFDKKGRPISPAPLRSVAVMASKALMDLHGIKEATEMKHTVETGEGGGGITFNVILPNQTTVESGDAK